MNKWPGAIFTTFIFFETYDWAQKAGVLNNNRLEKLASNKHASFLGPFVCFGENEALWILDQDSDNDSANHLWPELQDFFSLSLSLLKIS